MMKAAIFIVLLSYAAASSITNRNFRQDTAKYQSTIVENVLKHAPRDARLLSFKSTGPITSSQLIGSLVDNATLIRENIVGGFDCTGRQFGYYADTNNDCQIFHLCVNMMQIFPLHYGVEDIMMFSFICPKYTIFTQDAMVCAWERSAIPCEVAPQLYYLNNNFFVIPEDVQKETTGEGETVVVAPAPAPVPLTFREG